MAQLALKIGRPSLAHLDWQGLLVVSAVANLGLLLAIALSQQDVLALVLALLLVLGLGLLSLRGGRSGAAVLGLVNIYIAVYTLSSAVSNIIYGGATSAVAISAALGAIALAGLTGVGGLFLGRRRAEAGVALPVVARVLALFCLLILASVVTPAQQKGAAVDEIMLVSENMAFSTTAMTANSGTLTLALTNHDLVWHTFTIEALGVNLTVPAGGQRATKFTAPPGTYSFYCALPGHRLAGMEGKLTVAAPE
jgi:plastocyanin